MTDVRREPTPAALAAERLLLERCLGGEAGARRELVVLHHASIRQTVELAGARWGGGLVAADIEDALQQAFFAFFARDMLVLRRWRGDARLKTYLNRVAERVAAKHFRSVSGHGRRFLLVFGGAGTDEDPGAETTLDAIVVDAQQRGLLDGAPDLQQRIEGVEAQAELRAAIWSRLSEKGRDYYRHLFIDELDLAEICRREGTNPNNVYQWKNRILHEAATVLAELRGGPGRSPEGSPGRSRQG